MSERNINKDVFANMVKENTLVDCRERKAIKSSWLDLKEYRNEKYFFERQQSKVPISFTQIGKSN